MLVSKEDFVKEIKRRQSERNKRQFEEKLALDRIREHGVRSISHYRRAGWGS